MFRCSVLSIFNGLIIRCYGIRKPFSVTGKISSGRWDREPGVCPMGTPRPPDSPIPQLDSWVTHTGAYCLSTCDYNYNRDTRWHRAGQSVRVWWILAQRDRHAVTDARIAVTQKLPRTHLCLFWRHTTADCKSLCTQNLIGWLTGWTSIESWCYFSVNALRE